MTMMISMIGALALAVIPLVLGWRRTAREADMARALGLAAEAKGFDAERFARRTGTGLNFRQLVVGHLVWTGAAYLAGSLFGFMGGILFAAGGFLLYNGTLSGRREDLRMTQAKDILRAMSVLETLLTQGRTLTDALTESSDATGPHGRLVLSDLVIRLRSAPVEAQPDAVRGWTLAWESPAVDLVGTALLAALQDRIEITPLVGALRGTLTDVVDVLSRARAAAKGVEWQARFLAIFPPAVLAAIALTTPEMGRTYAANPLLLLPVLAGSGLSYALSMRMIRTGLSVESSLGLQGAGERSIHLDRLGKVL